MLKCFPLSSPNTIIIGATFSYVFGAFDSNSSLMRIYFQISLFLCARLATQILSLGWMMPSWIKIDKTEGGGDCNKNVTVNICSKKVTLGGRLFRTGE